MLFMEFSFAFVSYIPIEMSTTHIVIGNYSSRLAIILCLMLATITRGSLTRICEHPAYFVATALMFSVGIFISYFSILLLPPTSIERSLEWLPLGGFLEGTGFVLLLIAWVTQIAKLPPKTACLVIGGSLLVGTLGYYCVTLVADYSRTVEALLYILLPSASLLCLRTAKKGIPSRGKSPARQTAKQTDAKGAVKVGLLMFVAVLICSAVYGHIQTIVRDVGESHTLTIKLISFLTMAVMLTVILIICGRNPGRTVRSAYKVSLPIIFAGFLLFPFCTGDLVLLPSVIVFAGYACFTLCTILVTAMTSQSIGISLPLALILVFLAEAIGNVIGVFSSMTLLGTRSVSDEFFYQGTLVLMALVCFAIGYLFDFALAKSWQHTLGPTPTNDFELLEHIAALFGLTARESDVFMLLAQGRRANEIAEALVISLGTTRNHIHKVYEKLGVSSYGSMAKLIREIERER
jgi:DNA-binding CsgD family transcriptional regulator/uncharacterized membrane protein